MPQSLSKSYNSSTQRLIWLESLPQRYVTSIRDTVTSQRGSKGKSTQGLYGWSLDLSSILSWPRDCEGQSHKIATQRLLQLESSPRSYVTSLRDIVTSLRDCEESCPENPTQRFYGQSLDLRVLSSPPRDSEGQSLDLRGITSQTRDSYG